MKTLGRFKSARCDGTSEITVYIGKLNSEQPPLLRREFVKLAETETSVDSLELGDFPPPRHRLATAPQSAT
jgi:hypothetical protein